ncbi:MAG TPA: DUF1269 domain-containing protein [Mycobacterium sp.]|nr:DUF1269 domain-containing protein [Mycobacterium sp.]HTX96884.1 DUF1269 domain-containing protein [Mycobacterium sp.]
MTVNVIAVTFDEQSKAYQALSTLKGLDRDGRLELKSAAIVERSAAGQLQIPEGADNVGGEGIAVGGLIGTLVGVLGGPIGMLLGLGTGGLIGGLYDLDEQDMEDATLLQVGRHIPPGHNALLAEVDEYANDVVDGAMAELGGSVLRRSAEDVLAEIEAADEAADEAKKQARKKARERKKAELHEKYEERKDHLREKLHIG